MNGREEELCIGPKGETVEYFDWVRLRSQKGLESAELIVSAEKKSDGKCFWSALGDGADKS